jgi:hypothetical protein
MSFGASQTLRDPKGAFLLSFITLTIAVSAFFINLAEQSVGTVSVLLEKPGSGAYTAELSLVNGGLTSMRAADATGTAQPAPAYNGPRGSVIQLTPAGIEQRSENGDTEVLIISVTPPTAETPFAVWGKGSLIAWVSPTDQSLQVFARTPRGSYQPLFVSSSVRADSLGFTDDGAALVVTTVSRTDAGDVVSTEVHAVSTALPTKTLNPLASYSGLVTIRN